MRSLLLASLLALMLVPFATAQDESPEDAARKRAERNAERSMRSYRSLALSQSQQETIKKILVEYELASTKRTEARRAKVKEVLTPDQKETYQKMIDRYTSRNNRGGSRGNQGSQTLRWIGLDPAKIKTAVGLDAAQEKQVGEILAAIGKTAEEKSRAMRSGRNFDWNAFREVAKNLRKEAVAKITPLLKDEQKPKLTKMIADYEKQVAEWSARQGQRGNNNRTRTPRTTAPKDPEALIKDTLEMAMTDLALGQEEAAVIQPLVEKVIRYQSESARSLSNLRAAIARTTEPDAIKAKVEAFRTARTEVAKKLALMQDGLRELLTMEQEAKMVSRGILD